MPIVDGVSKPAGVPCAHLTADRRCALFGDPLRPPVCTTLKPSPQMCGSHRDEALLWLTQLEAATAVSPS
jgi:hypothetical protein